MDELTEQILAEKENVDNAMNNRRTAMARTKKQLLNWRLLPLFFTTYIMGLKI